MRASLCRTRSPRVLTRRGSPSFAGQRAAARCSSSSSSIPSGQRRRNEAERTQGMRSKAVCAVSRFTVKKFPARALRAICSICARDTWSSGVDTTRCFKGNTGRRCNAMAPAHASTAPPASSSASASRLISIGRSQKPSPLPLPCSTRRLSRPLPFEPPRALATTSLREQFEHELRKRNPGCPCRHRHQRMVGHAR